MPEFVAIFEKGVDLLGDGAVGVGKDADAFHESLFLGCGLYCERMTPPMAMSMPRTLLKEMVSCPMSSATSMVKTGMALLKMPAEAAPIFLTP